MKNKAGIIIGFILGVAGFLLLFKLIILDRVPPEDELAPGMVLIAAILNGLLFAYIGSLIQKNVMKKRINK
jgi:divalent metal cation (Fe/Co/Zn/Cd) transporter